MRRGARRARASPCRAPACSSSASPTSRASPTSASRRPSRSSTCLDRPRRRGLLHRCPRPGGHGSRAARASIGVDDPAAADADLVLVPHRPPRRRPRLDRPAARRCSTPPTGWTSPTGWSRDAVDRRSARRPPDRRHRVVDRCGDRWRRATVRRGATLAGGRLPLLADRRRQGGRPHRRPVAQRLRHRRPALDRRPSSTSRSPATTTRRRRPPPTPVDARRSRASSRCRTTRR